MHGLLIGLGDLKDLLLLSILIRPELINHLLLFLQEVYAINLELELFVVFGDFIPQVDMQQQVFQGHLGKQIAKIAALELRVGKAHVLFNFEDDSVLTDYLTPDSIRI